MTYYYIDFENVKTAGLKGIDSLPSGDTVKIFAKGGSDQMKFNDIKTLMNAKPTVAIEDVVTGTKNALDFQLLADLTIDCTKMAGMKPVPKFIIISADHGYDPAITQIKKRGFNNVYRAVSIKDAENGNFCGERQKQSKPQPKAAPKAGDEKHGPQPAKKDEEQTKPAASRSPAEGLLRESLLPLLPKMQIRNPRQKRSLSLSRIRSPRQGASTQGLSIKPKRIRQKRRKISVFL